MSQLHLRARIASFVIGTGMWAGCPAAHTTTDETPPRQEPAAAPQADASTPSTEISAPIDDADWIVLTKGGELLLTHDGNDHVRVRHAAYHRDWKYARFKIKAQKAPQGERSFTVKFSDLPITLKGHLHRTDAQTLRIDYLIDISEDIDDLDGLGLEFQIGKPHPPQVEVLGGDATIGVGDEGSIALNFGDEGLKPQTQVHRRRTNVLQSFWIKGSPRAGTHSASVEIKLPSPYMLEPPIKDRYGPVVQKTWIPDAMVWNDWPVDVSFLNREHGPAGSHGPIEVRGDSLVFKDGTPALFWGTNIAARALFDADDDAIALQARRLSALGYNLVRLHHADAGWIDRNVFDPRDGTTQTLDPKALERLDAWVAALAKEGIYTWVDLNVTRSFTPGDRIPAYDELGPRDTHQAKGSSYVNPRVEELMQKFAESYLNRVNPRRKMSWRDDPAIVGVLITNENDLTDHYGMAFGPKSGRPKHTEMFKKQTVDIVKQLGLTAREARQVWKPGPAKVLLAELQHRFDVRQIRHLRDMGVRAPLVTTNHWGDAKAYSLTPLSFGDIIDVHTYGKAESLSKDPREKHSWIHAIATAQVVGKPLSVSEWNVAPPAADRFTAPLWASAMASLQQWDAMMAFAYTQHPIAAPARHGTWISWIDPALQGLAPTAALMYRRGYVSAAKKTFVLQPDLETWWGTKIGPPKSAAIRTLAEQSRLLISIPDHPDLDWDQGNPIPKGATVISDPRQSFLDDNASVIRSDTGELERDWEAGVLRIDTPRVQAVSGWIGGRTIRLGDVQFEITTPKATVAVISLDGRPITNSENLLVTAVGRAVPRRGNPGHFVSEPIVGTLEMSAKSPRVLVPARSATSATKSTGLEPTPVKDSKRVRFALDANLGTHWFHIVPPSASTKTSKPRRGGAG